MEVSRPDIASEYFEEYPPDVSFLKFPAEKYLGLLKGPDGSPMKALPSQMAVVNAINNPRYRFVCAALSRRQGKTFIANVIGQLVTLLPGAQVLIMSPNYSLSQISFDIQRKLIKEFNLEVVRDNSKDKIIELSNGSVVRMGSVNQVDSCVGRSYDLIIFDEAALADGEEAFNVALRPTLDKDNSKALFISTPRGRNNWFSRFYERGFDEATPSWASIHATWMDNPRMSEADIEEARSTTSEAEFAQEYMADFNIFQGQIYNFDFENDVQDLSMLDTTGMEIIAGLDVGFRDPTALVVIAYCYKTETYYILAEYLDNEMTTANQAARIKEILDRYGAEYCFIDAAAQQTRYDFAQDYDIATTNAVKSVEDGIGFVASLVDNHKIKVDKNCIEVLFMFDQYRWDDNPNLVKEKPKHDHACHIADAVRYGLYSFIVSGGTF